MATLPPEFLTLLMSFAPLFSEPVFQRVTLLTAGAILTPGRRTITNALRVLGRQHTPHFANFHRVLNRARWSSVPGHKRCNEFAAADMLEAKLASKQEVRRMRGRK